MTTEGLHDSENRMKNFQCLLEEINEEASIQMDRIKQLCETLPDDNDLSLNLEIEDINQFIEHVGLESETAKQMQVNLSEETSEERQSGIAEVEEELIEAINSVTRPRPRPSASSSPGVSSTVRIVNEILEDKDEPRIIQVEDIATDNQQNPNLLYVTYLHDVLYVCATSILFLFSQRDHNENKVYPDLYYAIPATVS